MNVGVFIVFVATIKLEIVKYINFSEKGQFFLNRTALSFEMGK